MTRRLPAALVGGLLGALALAACDERPGPERRVWTRLALADERPAVLAPPAIRRGRSGRAANAPLGPADLFAGRKRGAGVPDPFPADLVRAVLQHPEATLVYGLELGEEPVLSFVPLPAKGAGRVRYRVRASVGEEEPRVLFDEAFPRGARFAAGERGVDLAAFAGQRIELRLELEPLGDSGTPAAEAGAEAALDAWGTPVVAWRERRAIEPEPPAERPDVLLLGLDTVRADALGPWASGVSLTPAIDRLAADSELWLRAYSCFNVTNPSFVSTFTGLYGLDHGVYDLSTPLSPAAVTLAERFRDGGYATFASLAAIHLAAAAGLGEGFDELRMPAGRIAAEGVVDRALDWYARRESEGDRRPAFVWLHLFDPHTPNTPPRPYAEGLRPKTAPGMRPVADWLPFRAPGPRSYEAPWVLGDRELYRGEVAYLDRQVGRLLDWLESRGRLDRTLLVLWSDHGENLGEHGLRSQHIGLFETTTHVPLLVRWPGRAHAGERQRAFVQNVDLFPTLLAAAGLPPAESRGHDLARLRGGEGRPAVYAESSDELSVRVRTPRWALFRTRALAGGIAAGTYLYDLESDPGETRNLAGTGLEAERELGTMLDRWLASGDRLRIERERQRELTEAERAELRALGYL